MNLIFFILAIIIVILTIYTMGRTIYTHKELIRAYKTSEFLFTSHIVISIMLSTIVFAVLLALNNSFWHLTL